MTEKTGIQESQLDKFKEAAREHAADESEQHWDERLKRVVKAKPAPDKRPSVNSVWDEAESADDGCLPAT